jgi:hypothetical protein
MRWDQFVVADGRQWLVELEAKAGLPSIGGVLPPSTSSSIAIRWIAAFMRAQLLGRAPWQAWNYFGAPGEDRPAAFYARFHEAYEWAFSQSGTAASTALLWLLGRDQSEPEIAVSASGHLWLVDREPIDLLARYQEVGSSVTCLLGETAGDLLG